ncbi:unnamed protein product [Nippostrongylus brasiliensis]|uniref:PPM-type phosphatase domain-containing protein n=1 Tax=Nippostrongylus brasiliensis TaxID=27835 RepID=A0A0N4YUZ0_NIPBR|nr:unnamed protein product [Nippostrongylus brasiliensis]
MMAVKEEVLDTSFEEDPESDILAMALGHPLPTKKINRKHVNDHYYSLFPGDQVEEDIKFSDTLLYAALSIFDGIHNRAEIV